jgi:hypothetical protein
VAHGGARCAEQTPKPGTCRADIALLCLRHVLGSWCTGPRWVFLCGNLAARVRGVVLGARSSLSGYTAKPPGRRAGALTTGLCWRTVSTTLPRQALLSRATGHTTRTWPCARPGNFRTLSTTLPRRCGPLSMEQPTVGMDSQQLFRTLAHSWYHFACTKPAIRPGPLRPGMGLPATVQSGDAHWVSLLP